jgi:hypothetical protein
VKAFVPNETGKKFNPHVTIGLATRDYLKKMLDEKFEAFTFSPEGAAVYHLGNLTPLSAIIRPSAISIGSPNDRYEIRLAGLQP